MKIVDAAVLLFALGMPAAPLNVQSASETPATPAQAGLPEGIVLPRSGTVFALEMNHMKPDLLQLHASEVVSNSHAASNFARGQVFMGPHATLELKGLNAPVHLADPQPAFYVRIGSEDAELMRSRVHLIKMNQTAERRVVLTFSQNIFGGQRSKKYEDIPVAKVDAEADMWLKVTPVAPLAPGEYGIVLMPKDAVMVPDAVYDFDVAFGDAKPEKDVKR